MVLCLVLMDDSLLAQPERIAGEKYTIRSDVWSTGISLLELVENRYPYPSDLGDIELMMCIAQSAVRPPSVSARASHADDGSSLHSLKVTGATK